MRNYQTIRYDIDDRVLTITLDRPDRLNAFTVEMCDELEDAFGAASADPAVGAVVVTGAGRTFCVGMDLSIGGDTFGLSDTAAPTLAELRQRVDDPDMIHGVRDTGGRVALAIFACLKPVIGAINGVAVGVGSTMTLPMDIRMASTEARFGFVFGRLGIVPEACSSWFLPRLVGMPRALEWCYRADVFPAAEAHEAGLVQSLHAPDALLAAAHDRARALIRDRSPAAIALTRQMLWRNSAGESPLEAHLVESLAVLATNRQDGAEGVSAFREKRPARFTAMPNDLPPWVRDWLEQRAPGSLSE